MSQHELLAVGSIVLSVLDILVLWLLALKKRWAWPLAIAVTSLWIPYGWFTGQLGFLPLGVAYMIVAILGWRNWRE